MRTQDNNHSARAFVLALAASFCVIMLCLVLCTGVGQAHAADTTVSEPDAAKVTVSNLKLEELGDGDEGSDTTSKRDYVLTGTLTNDNDQVVTAAVSLHVHEVYVDSYGDETVSEETGEYALENCSATPGVLDGTFVNLEAGEARDFEYYLRSVDYFYNNNVSRQDFVGFADPQITIDEVAGKITTFPDEPSMSIVDDDDVSISYEVEGETNVIKATNNTDKLYSDVIVVTSYLNDSASWPHETAIDSIGSIRPGATSEVAINADNGKTGSNSYVNDPRTIAVFAVEDTERPAVADFSEEFDAEIISEDGSLSPQVRIVNKTGKYLESVTVSVRINQEDDAPLTAPAYASYMAPGDEQVVDIDLLASNGVFIFDGPAVADMEIDDITYIVDEEKEAKMKG